MGLIIKGTIPRVPPFFLWAVSRLYPFSSLLGDDEAPNMSSKDMGCPVEGIHTLRVLFIWNSPVDSWSQVRLAVGWSRTIRSVRKGEGSLTPDLAHCTKNPLENLVVFLGDVIDTERIRIPQIGITVGILKARKWGCSYHWAKLQRWDGRVETTKDGTFIWCDIKNVESPQEVVFEYIFGDDMLIFIMLGVHVGLVMDIHCMDSQVADHLAFLSHRSWWISLRIQTSLQRYWMIKRRQRESDGQNADGDIWER